MITSKQRQWLMSVLTPPTGVPDEQSVLGMGFLPWKACEGDTWHEQDFLRVVQLQSAVDNKRSTVTLRLAYVVCDKSPDTAHWCCDPININDVSCYRLSDKYEKDLDLTDGIVLDATSAQLPVDAVFKCVSKLKYALDARARLDQLEREQEREQQAAIRDAELKYAHARSSLLDKLRMDIGKLDKEDNE